MLLLQIFIFAISLLAFMVRPGLATFIFVLGYVGWLFFLATEMARDERLHDEWERLN
ncbi:hypothetical protein [Alkanindiges illinoisensis]|uniref:hypothetical protein n=1 Tax=Alkanindiges illinoisensis TaxID=197183 RepID=UPI0012EC9BE3|nr:hypothetical protein [Alkanindiges illinoisensis]